MRIAGFVSIVVLFVTVCGAQTPAAPPEQFRVWGSIAPESPPLPAGWTEVRGAPDALPASFPLTPTPDEQRRGYVLFARDPMMGVGDDSTPASSERVSEIGAFAAIGEYEPLTFVIHALADLKDVRVEVGALRGDEQSVIPADYFDVRVVRSVRVAVNPKAKTYRLQPFLLERRATFSVPKGKSAQIWLTLKVPETAKPGHHKGTVSVQAAGREAAQLQLSVRVLPFALPAAPIEMAMYAPRPSESDEMLAKEFTDAREHGLTGFEPSMAVEVKSRDRKFGEDDVAAVRADCKRRMDAVKKAYGGWRFPATFEVGHQIAFYWDQGKNWFSFWPHGKEIEDDFLKAMRVVSDLAKAEGWPPLCVYALDEAGAHNLLDEAVYYFRFIKERMPQLATLTTIGGGMAMGLDEIGQLSPVVDFFSTNRFTPEIARALITRGKSYGIYNGCGPTPAGARFFFGFYGWKTGAQQIGQWAYHFGDAVFEGNGFRRDDEGYVYLAKDGPLPSLMWEGVREGIDDYRYTYRLSRLIAAARGSNKAAAQSAAKDASRDLNDLLGNIGWQFQALQSEERTPPPHPATLRKWRWKVAQHIVALQTLIGPDAILPTSIVRVSPFDYPWASAEKDESSFGAEMLPPSDFETAMKPWRIETWKGPGKGELDATEHHGGKQSARIEIPAGSGSDAVTVLVWPKWGGGALNLVLDGDRTYEFSAWVKVKDRSVPPTLRIALPQSATRTTRAGRDQPTPDGWQRVWLRVEMNFRAEPNDLAVWVQGPGTVWMDDLSLREVIPPALGLSLDQKEYDGVDKIGIATVTIAKRATPAHVRFALSRKGGETIAELTAPFEAQVTVASAPQKENVPLILVAPADLRTCRFVFDPSSLEPGEYEAKTELLGPQSKPIASKTVMLQRNRD